MRSGPFPHIYVLLIAVLFEHCVLRVRICVRTARAATCSSHACARQIRAHVHVRRANLSCSCLLCLLLLVSMAYLPDCYGNMELKDSDVGLQLTVAGDEGGEGGSYAWHPAREFSC